MSEHRIALHWARNGGPFERGNYTRDHQVTFGEQAMQASSAADFGGTPGRADPEQMLASALASCHMLTFLAVVANRGFEVEDYRDDAVAELGKNADGQMAVTRIRLRPMVRFSNANVPSQEDLEKFHERAHRACFIANSIQCAVEIEPHPSGGINPE